MAETELKTDPFNIHISQNSSATCYKFGYKFGLSVAYCVILHAFLSSADFFQNQCFKKNLTGIPSECQTAWIQIRSDILLGLIWVQTDSKGYQQMTLFGKELNNFSFPFNFLMHFFSVVTF